MPFDMTAPRPLRYEERELILSLLPKTQSGVSLNADVRVRDMADGAMGSIRFVNAEERHFGRELASAEYTDSDGVLVSIALNLDNLGDLYEVDFWKVDFSSLKRYPRADELRIHS